MNRYLLSEKKQSRYFKIGSDILKYLKRYLFFHSDIFWDILEDILNHIFGTCRYHLRYLSRYLSRYVEISKWPWDIFFQSKISWKISTHIWKTQKISFYVQDILKILEYSLLHCLVQDSSRPARPGCNPCLVRLSEFFFPLPLIRSYDRSHILGKLCFHFQLASSALAIVRLNHFLAPTTIGRWRSGWISRRIYRRNMAVRIIWDGGGAFLFSHFEPKLLKCCVADRHASRKLISPFLLLKFVDPIAVPLALFFELVVWQLPLWLLHRLLCLHDQGFIWPPFTLEKAR